MLPDIVLANPRTMNARPRRVIPTARREENVTVLPLLLPVSGVHLSAHILLLETRYQPGITENMKKAAKEIVRVGRETGCAR